MGWIAELALGKLTAVELDKSWRRELMLTWVQFVDRKTGLCGLYAGAVMPAGDAKVCALQKEFEKAMYEQYSKSRNVSPRL